MKLLQFSLLFFGAAALTVPFISLPVSAQPSGYGSDFRQSRPLNSNQPGYGAGCLIHNPDMSIPNFDSQKQRLHNSLINASFYNR